MARRPPAPGQGSVRKRFVFEPCRPGGRLVTVTAPSQNLPVECSTARFSSLSPPRTQADSFKFARSSAPPARRVPKPRPACRPAVGHNFPGPGAGESVASLSPCQASWAATDLPGRALRALGVRAPTGRSVARPAVYPWRPPRLAPSQGGSRAGTGTVLLVPVITGPS